MSCMFWFLAADTVPNLPLSHSLLPPATESAFGRCRIQATWLRVGGEVGHALTAARLRARPPDLRVNFRQGAIDFASPQLFQSDL